jgi:hypothetical protein
LVKRKENNRVVLQFKEYEILTVWFNAWRYEREEHYALIALTQYKGDTKQRKRA